LIPSEVLISISSNITSSSSGDPVVSLKNRVKQLERFFILNESKLTGETKAQVWEFTLNTFEDYSFEDVISTLQTRYPECKLPKNWLEDLERENEIG
jgi:hypothetical protein